MKRSLIALGLALAMPARAELLDDRVVLASVLAHTVIIEAQSKEALFFERCDYAPPNAHVVEREILADHLLNCNPVGPILSNTPEVREYLEQRFVEQLEARVKRLDETGFALPILRQVGAAGVMGGLAIGGAEHLIRRPGIRRVFRTAALGTVAAAGIAAVMKVIEARQARYEQTRSKQMLKVIDLRIPSDPHLVDERTTSKAEAVHVMKLFVESLRVATEQTRAATHALPTDSTKPM